jgi:uncharacterized protein
MRFSHSNAIEARRVKGKGLGVFARRPIRAGEEIERVPVLVLPLAEIQHQAGPNRLVDYCFLWGRGTIAVALGYGSLYNHSYQPNARYDDKANRTKVFTAIRDITAGEEITINYNGDPDDREAVGFKVLESQAQNHQSPNPRRSPLARVRGQVPDSSGGNQDSIGEQS